MRNVAFIFFRIRIFPNRPESSWKREKPTENFQPTNPPLGSIFLFVIYSSCFSYPNSNYTKNYIILSKSYFQILQKITSNKSARHIENQWMYVTVSMMTKPRLTWRRPFLLNHAKQFTLRFFFPGRSKVTNPFFCNNHIAPTHLNWI